ncbi:melanocortin 2 receptor accessory protein [Homo sapiens]|uniref:Isoform 2 of Melanocortin-2 receptor accessory protein n=1 Tax=Homo sapiens TaxID=9606 RepID=Q8TCY5-2|nr:melanocortin-2 receptor accessory protein isoform beta [Homo sapiens]AAL86908.1 fat cell-specific low molecular weight protein beta [Homo sapiens]EAX09878.1 melanocortin 2 receptor accessory protein, isoform CRA_a [Homo sapiens]KAI2595917.1 melanocortin 2 receptor accessory protein [Homo sapiens]KAI4003783.1 melanocortin 2 receptor accessory protein [Homo sapiens]|eukprot:NP_996781.1 melanocortin-2 receptor accessory protein isoform beta [Homo sapiens]
MANGTNASAPYYSYEYYLDYLDLIPVDEKKLKAHKHSIVIAFWVSLAAFVVLLFLILLYMSWSASPQMSFNTDESLLHSEVLPQTRAISCDELQAPREEGAA